MKTNGVVVVELGLFPGHAGDERDCRVVAVRGIRGDAGRLTRVELDGVFIGSIEPGGEPEDVVALVEQYDRRVAALAAQVVQPFQAGDRVVARHNADADDCDVYTVRYAHPDGQMVSTLEPDPDGDTGLTGRMFNQQARDMVLRERPVPEPAPSAGCLAWFFAPYGARIEARYTGGVSHYGALTAAEPTRFEVIGYPPNGGPVDILGSDLDADSAVRLAAEASGWDVQA